MFALPVFPTFLGLGSVMVESGTFFVVRFAFNDARTVSHRPVSENVPFILTLFLKNCFHQFLFFHTKNLKNHKDLKKLHNHDLS